MESLFKQLGVHEAKLLQSEGLFYVILTTEDRMTLVSGSRALITEALASALQALQDVLEEEKRSGVSHKGRLNLRK